MQFKEVFILGHGLRRDKVDHSWQQDSKATDHIDRKERMDRLQGLAMKPQDPLSMTHAFQ